ncbi:MAG: trypsin-like peptidase domain-containing protein [Candidatus Krumholzibacteria bacterium]|nr:trypsin-like peptidase domain-containing protein [Candidatus Krumholzibacteria bacterium]
MKLFETRRERIFPYILGALFGLSIALLVVSILMFRKAAENAPFLPPSTAKSGSERVDDERKSAIVEATRRVSPAVVSVTALRTEIVRTHPMFSHQWFEKFFFNRRIQRLRRREYSTLGSGVIVNPNGYILTNEHVISEAEGVFVTLNDGTEMAATVVGLSADYDLALLSIDARGLSYAPVGDSDGLEIGEWVIAIGSPFGHLLNDTQPTVTVGVVSALNRDVKSNPETEAVFKNMIQTDAAINPGNSGGPLVSSSGEVIGINTFIFSTSDGSNLGMGFAIPINTAKMVIDEFVRFGRVRSVWTGLTVRELTPEVANALGISIKSGLFVDRIAESSPADIAGMEVGDVITEIDRVKIQNASQADRVVFGHRVGDVLNIVVQRGDSSITIKLELAERPKKA